MVQHLSVINWWKWCGLPYMALEEHPDDQGFIVCEPDFCFTRAEAESMQQAVDAHESRISLETRFEEMEADAPLTESGEVFKAELREWKKALEKERLRSSGRPWPSAEIEKGASASASGLTAKASAPLPFSGKLTGDFDEKVAWRAFAPPAHRRSASSHADDEISEAVQDVTDTFNLCAKLGKKHMAWMSWNAEQWTHGKAARQMSPSTGAQMVCLSAVGARKLKRRMQAEPRDMHMGSVIKLWWLQDWKEILGCYVCPPIGSFYTHSSTTDKAEKILETHFGDRWAQEGTRKRVGVDSDYHRVACLATLSGHAHVISEPFRLPEMHEQAAWFTEAPRGTAPTSLGRRPRHGSNPGDKDPIGDGTKRQQKAWTQHINDDSSDDEDGNEGPRPKRRRRTKNELATRRKHTQAYCRRIFAAPGQKFDVPWWRPQSLGKYEHNDGPKIIGWAPPEVPAYNASMTLLATKAPPPQSASSSSAMLETHQDVSRADPSTPTNPQSSDDEEVHAPTVAGESCIGEDLDSTVWSLLEDFSTRGERH